MVLSKRVVCVLALVMCLGISSFALGQEDGSVPIKITAEKLSYDAGGQKVRFMDNVQVIHPDATLWADSIEILLVDRNEKKNNTASDNENPSMDPGNIEQILASGNVRVQMTDGKKGTCQHAVYVIVSGVLTMTGDPVLQEGENSIQGRKITFFVKENRSEVSGSSDSPVEAIFSAPKRVTK